MGVSINGGILERMVENRIDMDDLGVPLFYETSTYLYPCISLSIHTYIYIDSSMSDFRHIAKRLSLSGALTSQFQWFSLEGTPPSTGCIRFLSSFRWSQMRVPGIPCTSFAASIMII